jgi:hypothetical protein
LFVIRFAPPPVTATFKQNCVGIFSDLGRL